MRGSRALISQAIANLLDNALWFTPTGGKITLAAYAASDGVVLEVAGAEDDLARLVRRLVEAGMDPIEFSPKATDLEDVFLSLTAGTVQ